MELLFLALMVVSLITVFTIDTRQKRRKFLNESG